MDETELVIVSGERQARLLTQALFNNLGVEARFRIADHRDTQFRYQVFTAARLTKARAAEAAAFCRGFAACLNAL